MRALIGISMGLLIGLSACTAPQEQDLSGVAFHVLPWRVRLHDLPPGLDAERTQQQLQEQLDQLAASISNWQPGSEIDRFNQQQAGHWITVSPRLYHTVAEACQVGQQAGGYDISALPLVNLWGFGPQGRRTQAPSAQQIQQALQQVDQRMLLFDAPRHALFKRRPLSLDLASVGEGAAADVLSLWLDRHGVHDYLIYVAGAVAGHGRRRDGQAWRVGIERPDGSGRPIQAIELQDACLSTAGTYRRHFQQAGHDYSHILDARTGYPIQHAGLSVSVLMPRTSGDCTLADAWDTALLVQTPEQSLALSRRQELASLVIWKTTQGLVTAASPGFPPAISLLPADATP